MRKTIELRNRQATEQIVEVHCLGDAAALFVEGLYFVSETEQRLL
jgi:hypothetical protein